MSHTKKPSTSVQLSEGSSSKSYRAVQLAVEEPIIVPARSSISLRDFAFPLYSLSSSLSFLEASDYQNMMTKSLFTVNKIYKDPKSSCDETVADLPRCPMCLTPSFALVLFHSLSLIS